MRDLCSEPRPPLNRFADAVMDMQDFLENTTEPYYNGSVTIGVHGGRGFEHCFNGYGILVRLGRRRRSKRPIGSRAAACVARTHNVKMGL